MSDPRMGHLTLQLGSTYTGTNSPINEILTKLFLLEKNLLSNNSNKIHLPTLTKRNYGSAISLPGNKGDKRKA